MSPVIKHFLYSCFIIIIIFWGGGGGGIFSVPIGLYLFSNSSVLVSICLGSNFKSGHSSNF